MMRAFSLVGFAIAISFNGYSQASEKWYFNEWGEPASKDSSTYYRIWLTEKQALNPYTYYTLNNQLKAYEPKQEGVFHGEVVYYHENGQVHFKAKYSEGKAFGTIITYYPNGKIQKIQSHDSVSTEFKNSEASLLQYYDSAGNQLVKNGNGEVIEYFKRKPGYWLSRGRVKGGLKDSVWMSFYPNGKTFYQEQWSVGEFQKGKSFNEAGEATEYTELETQASPNGGIAAYYSYLAKALKYPATAKRMGIEGRVFVDFIVEKDGSISNVKILRGIDADCDKEAIRVVSSSRQWKPGLQRGQPVRTRFNLPIIFKLKA